jgi:hypothetical protein
VDHRAERFRRERLVEKRCGPCLEGALTNARLEAGGHQDDGRPPIEGVGLELSENLPTIDVRHHDVQNDPVVPPSLQLYERLTASRRGVDVEPISDEDHPFKS